MYRVVACGVNNGLAFAEKDAEDVATHFRGALGPPAADEQVVLLQGAAASGSAIEIAIHLARFTKPQFLVVYFSGHGSRGGVHAADGSSDSIP